MPAQPKEYRKACTLCQTLRDVLVRCQIDETETWHFVCPGSCWKRVSGGTIDGDGSEAHQFYRYGGMWKNKHEAVSAKKPKASKRKTATNVNESEGTVQDEDHSDSDQGVPVAAVASQSSRSTHPLWTGEEHRYTKKDRIVYGDEVWICRKSHCSQESKPPPKAISVWKEQKGLIEDEDTE